MSNTIENFKFLKKEDGNIYLQLLDYEPIISLNFEDLIEDFPDNTFSNLKEYYDIIDDGKSIDCYEDNEVFSFDVNINIEGEETQIYDEISVTKEETFTINEISEINGDFYINISYEAQCVEVEEDMVPKYGNFFVETINDKIEKYNIDSTSYSYLRVNKNDLSIETFENEEDFNNAINEAEMKSNSLSM